MERVLHESLFGEYGNFGGICMELMLQHCLIHKPAYPSVQQPEAVAVCSPSAT